MSSIKLISDYWHERYPLRIFLPFAILIAAAGMAAGGSWPTVHDAITSCLLAYALVLVFRILDDLADLSHDVAQHPERKLVKATSRAPIVALALAIALGIILLLSSLSHPWIRIAIFVAIWLWLMLWYARRTPLRAGPLAGAHILLLKYPAIALLTSTGWDRMTPYTALPPLTAIYLGLCIYEQIHDDTVRQSRWAAWIFASELGLLFSLPLLPLFTRGILP
jgi:hypothetical protein